MDTFEFSSGTPPLLSPPPLSPPLSTPPTSWCGEHTFSPVESGDGLSTCFGAIVVQPAPSVMLLALASVAALRSLCAEDAPVEMEAAPRFHRRIAAFCAALLGLSAAALLAFSLAPKTRQPPAWRLAPAVDAFAAATCLAGLYGPFSTLRNARPVLGIYAILEAAVTLAVALLSSDELHSSLLLAFALGRVLACAVLALAMLWPAREEAGARARLGGGGGGGGGGEALLRGRREGRHASVAGWESYIGGGDGVSYSLQAEIPGRVTEGGTITSASASGSGYNSGARHKIRIRERIHFTHHPFMHARTT